MRAGYLWLASFLVFPIVGAPLLSHRTFRIFGIPTRMVLSAGVGAVLVSWTMTVFALLELRWGPALVLVAAAIAFALRLALRGDREIPSPRLRKGGVEGRSSRAIVLIAYGITAASLAAALLATIAGRSTSTDLLLFWGPKAQQFAAARTIDVAFLSAPFLEYLHVYYPPLVTNVLAFGAMIAGRFPWGAAMLTFPLLLAATAVGLTGILRTGAPSPAAAATTALTVSAIALLGIHASVAGNAEPFLLFFEILGLALLLTPIARSTGGKLAAGLLFAGAAASKVEGLVFVLAAGALFVLIERNASRPLWRTLLLLFAPTALALGTWFLFGASRSLFWGYKGYGGLVRISLESLPSILQAVGVSLRRAGYALPWLVPLAVFLLIPGKSRRALLPGLAAVALAGFLLFTYLTTQSDPRLLISWSAARVLSPLTALFALASFAGRSAQ
jgi:hypothetical protein